MITVKFDSSKIAGRLKAKENALKQNTRKAVQAGAQVYYDDVRARVPVSAEAHIFQSKRRKDGTPGQKYLYYPGDLKRAIYQKYVPEQSGESTARYHISWRKTGPKAVPYGYMVEHGTSRTPAKPFLRPAYSAKRKEAVAATRAVLRKAWKEA